MCSIYFIRTEYPSRCDHTDGQLTFLHGTCLYRRGLGSEQNGVVNKKCILFVSCRMVFRDIQLCKVIISIFHFRAFYYLIAHSNKDTLYLFQGNGIRVTMSQLSSSLQEVSHRSLLLSFSLHEQLLPVSA